MKSLAGIALLALSCGGGGTTADDMPCQTADCMIPGRVVVKWVFDQRLDWLFAGDTCIDLGVSTVHVVATNTADANVSKAVDAPCGDGQATLEGLAGGTYNVALTPLGADSASVVTAPVMGDAPVTAPAEGAMTETTVQVPYTAWSGTFTGTFLFQLTWGGKSCAMATPPVAKQTLTIAKNGTPIAGAVTDLGQRMDGTDPQPCRPNTGFAQFSTMLPFGPVTITVVGTDASNAVHFSHSFDTFVGAGKNNPTITLDTLPPDAPPPPDAPVDAAPDAS